MLRAILFAVLASAVAAPPSADDARQLLNRSVAAMGGETALRGGGGR